MKLRPAVLFVSMLSLPSFGQDVGAIGSSPVRGGEVRALEAKVEQIDAEITSVEEQAKFLARRDRKFYEGLGGLESQGRDDEVARRSGDPVGLDARSAASMAASGRLNAGKVLGDVGEDAAVGGGEAEGDTERDEHDVEQREDDVEREDTDRDDEDRSEEDEDGHAKNGDGADRAGEDALSLDKEGRETESRHEEGSGNEDNAKDNTNQKKDEERDDSKTRKQVQGKASRREAAEPLTHEEGELTELAAQREQGEESGEGEDESDLDEEGRDQESEEDDDAEEDEEDSEGAGRDDEGVDDNEED